MSEVNEVNVNDLIEVEEVRMLDDICALEPGSDEHKVAIDTLDTLSGIKLADEKFKADYDDKIQKNAMETEARDREYEIEHEKLITEKLKVAGTVLAASIPAVVKLIEVCVGRKNHVELLAQRKTETALLDKYFETIMYFEEKGKVVSDAGRQFLNKVLLKYEK